MKCECGKELNHHSLKCASCGRAWRLDATVMGTQPSPEPPIEQWQEELKSRPKATEESLAEVMRESELRNRGKNKRRKVKKTQRRYAGTQIRKPASIVKFGSFLLLVAIIAGLVDLTQRFASFFLIHYGFLTYGIMILTILVSLLGFRNSRLIERVKFQSSLVYEQGQWYRVLTTGLVHADAGHRVRLSGYCPHLS